MFTHSLDPVIFSIGPLPIRWYSIVYIAGFLLAYWLLRKYHERIKGMTPQKVEDFITWLMVGGIVGARLGHVIFYNLPYYVANPLKIIAVWEGGMSFHGGLVGAFIATWWFCKKYNVRFFQLADFLVAPFSLVLFFGRIANFINAELVGTVTDVSWCVNFPNQEGCRHPSQIYEAGKNLVNFLILWPLSFRNLKEGTVFWLFFILYGLGRIITNIWRQPESGEFVALGMSMGQWLSIPMILIGSYMLFTLYVSQRR